MPIGPIGPFEFLILVLILYPLQALIAARLAGGKGYHFFLGFVLAAIFPFLGLLAVVLAPARTQQAV